MFRNPTRLRVAAPALAAMAAVLALTPLLLSRGSAHAASATPILAAAGHSVHREWPRLSADPARDSADALTAPQLVSPAEGQTNVSLTPTLAWNAAAGATSYTAYIWDPAAVVLAWQVTTSALSAGVPAGNALQRGRFYYYSVVSCNASSCSNYARWLGFTTRSTLQTPQLSAPIEGATSVSITPTLRWGAVAEAAQYTVFIWDPAASAMAFQQSTSGTSAAVPAASPLTGGHFYYASIQACTVADCSALARWIGFTTAAGLGIPALLSPAEGAQNVSPTPTLQWGAASGATPGSTVYTAFVWDPSASKMMFQQSTTTLTADVSAGAGLQASHFYYWTVQACNGMACGALARWIGFTTAAGLGAPALLSPVEGAQNVSLTPALQWSAARGATPGSTLYTASVWDPSASQMTFKQSTPAVTVNLTASAALQASHFYYWTVQACNGAACGPAARWIGFTTAAQPTGGGIWYPALNTSWQWELDGNVDLSVNAAVYDVDLFETSAATVTSLHAQGRRAICYISAGTYENWRPDAAQFPAGVLGAGNGWPGEKWLDIRRIDLLGPIMTARMDLCKQKGFDAIEPDNVDGYANSTGFSLTYQDQINFNTWIANQAHARGLSVALKNDLDQVGDLLPAFDFAVNEQCFQYGECSALQPFISAGKAVFEVEYNLSTSQFCPQANALDFNAMLKHLSLDAYRVPCR